MSGPIEIANQAFKQDVGRYNAAWRAVVASEELRHVRQRLSIHQLKQIIGVIVQATGPTPRSIAMADWCEAEAENVTHTGTYAPTIIEAWLRNKAAELRDK